MNMMISYQELVRTFLSYTVVKTNRSRYSGLCNNKNISAAHKKLPFDTKLKVTNEANGKSVIVEVTDRGPFVRSKEIDLTKRAFMELADNKRSGMLRVKIEIIEN